MLRDLPLDTIQESDLHALVADAVSEDQYIDFKMKSYGAGEDAKKELLTDVCALANAQGGDLLLGVEEARGCAVSLPGLPSIDVDAEILRLDSIIRSGIEPSISNVRLRAIRFKTGHAVLMIRVPASLTAPHRLTVRRGGRFVRRNSAGNYDMDMQELRESFLGAENLTGRLARLHAVTVAGARGEDMPFSIGVLPAAALSFTPLDYFRQVRDVELDEFNSQQPYLARRPASTSWMPTLEGTLVHGLPGANAGDIIEGYAHTHRSGRVEAAWRLGGPRDVSPGAEKLLVFADHFERGLLDQATTAAERLRLVGIAGPWCLAVTVINIRGYELLNDFHNGVASYRNEARMPLLRLDAISQESLKPIYDAYWRLFGHKRPASRRLDS